MKPEPAVVKVRLGERSYPIIIGGGILDEVGARVAAMDFGGRAAVVTQRVPGRLFAKRLLASLEAAGFDPRLAVIPEGEGAKSIGEAARLWEFFIRHRLDRWSPVIALGGGVTGDLAGFAAGTYMRGLPFFQVPTTLVAQVDSSIGGKVAINHPLAKNIIGLFHQPRGVFIDPRTLSTLPARDLVAGLAEVIRYAAIADSRFFRFLEENLHRLLAREEETLTAAIRRSAAIKAAIVERDEREEGDTRALLNYGHTVGHAIEAATGYRRYRHGEAVAIGMAVACRLAAMRGVASAGLGERQINLLHNAGLPVTLRGISVDKVLKALMLDKKIKHGKIRFVLTVSMGRARVFDGVEAAEIAAALSSPKAAVTPALWRSRKRGKR